MMTTTLAHSPYAFEFPDTSSSRMTDPYLLMLSDEEQVGAERALLSESTTSLRQNETTQSNDSEGSIMLLHDEDNPFLLHDQNEETKDLLPSLDDEDFGRVIQDMLHNSQDDDEHPSWVAAARAHEASSTCGKARRNNSPRS
jgi:hypothetical protein